MPRVRFTRVELEAEVPLGHSLLEAAGIIGAPHGSRCGGVRACSKCHVYVVEGKELLSPIDADERELLELSAAEPRENSRLGCQAVVQAEGKVVVQISDESFEEFLDRNPGEREDALERWLR